MNTPLKTLLASISIALLTPMATLANDAHHKTATAAASTAARTAAATSAGTAAGTAADMTDAEVRKIDLEAGKITLKHADIKSLDMPAMTMVFVVKDKAMLDKLKAGDKVKFKAINDAGKYTVTEIQPAR